MTDSSHNPPLTRRALCQAGMAALAMPVLAQTMPATSRPEFRLRHILGSSMYGKASLAEILPEAKKIGAEHIDIWPAPHGDQREQIDEMGQETFVALLRRHQVGLGIVSRYDLGPFNLQNEMATVKKLGGQMSICASGGPKGLEGQDLKAAVRHFVEQMKPHAAVAERLDITIGIENHANALIDSVDSILWLAEAVKSRCIGIALAPYHLPQKPETIAKLIRGLGKRLVHFYAWEHGSGCHAKLPKEEELLQMPGRGSLDFEPILAALKEFDYAGFTEIFMHPVPRGIPIMETTAEVTAEINRARHYLESCLKAL